MSIYDEIGTNGRNFGDFCAILELLATERKE